MLENFMNLLEQRIEEIVNLGSHIIQCELKET